MKDWIAFLLIFAVMVFGLGMRIKTEIEVTESYTCPELKIQQFNKANSYGEPATEHIYVVSAEFETETEAQIYKAKAEEMIK